MVEIVEVSPRDGLQNESTLLSTADKIELVTRSVQAGIRRVEVTSFVHPKRVPQMADAEAVLAGLPRADGVRYIALVLNQRGLERAIAAEVDEINAVVVSTETFSQRNQGMSVAESLAAWRSTAAAARAAGIRPTVTIAAAFGCPFEGEVAVRKVAELAADVREGDPAEIALADTIGVGTPTDVQERVAAVADLSGDVPLRCHFHNTRNTGMANAYAAVQAGVQVLDASVGGIGGCPFAPAATGNIPTEDLVYMLDRMGVPTGISLTGVVDIATWIGARLGKTVPGLLSRAGPFPSPQG